jgi:hypothetical protein
MANKTVSFPEEQFNTLVNMFQLMAVAGLRFHATGNAIPSDEQIKDIWRTLSRAALDKNKAQESMEEPIDFTKAAVGKEWACTLCDYRTKDTIEACVHSHMIHDVDDLSCKQVNIGAIEI